ncbi:methionyl-tRNA formyltransferase [Pseudacidovorax sp. NFM-22]|uniref:methionyl-tRNA formyltransferase n=1 Tax=Pseudacidovorax sp. NFM-22 TaxID=2744469 RepID=UPI001F001297|nr:methionyl-tRNA formyltransferase [Pseudacidovorax sp. NFM-22]
MRIVFAGTPEFARVALEALDAAGIEIALVLTQPDRPAGRGMKLQASPVKAHALTRGWPVAQPRSLRLDGRYPEDAALAREALVAARADAMVVAAYGLILPQWVLDLMAGPGEGAPAGTRALGCLNIHASLLPRWRGAAPIHRAIEAGDAETGVTIMQMDAGLDTGDMLLAESLAIGAEESTGQLHDRLASMGGRLIVQALRQAETGPLPRTPQPADGVTYAHKIEKAEARIDWTQDAATLARRVRAFDPFPGAVAELDGQPLKIWAAQARPAAGDTGPALGTVLRADAEGVVIAAGGGSLLVATQLQRAGGKRLAAADFLRGAPLAAGTVLA